MNRKDLITKIAQKTGQTKKSISAIVAAYEDSIIDAISRGDSVSLHTFMKIERKTKKRHSGYDFKNKCPIVVPEQECVEIRPGTALTECL